MKYIRTINGIYIAVKEFKTGDMIVIPDEGLVKIINQADTIEELCDEFVIVDDRPPKTKYVAQSIEKGYRFVKQCDIRNEDIFVYGAIWTNKGLIYVAKMNNDGELELCKD